ncbi:hypothetical protein H072_248 [Dactylellina haptotyla CBS 200.50]|uniref:Uncharacterized protein n=1 Tax=Dactylellina haptotyla (strain CBS 200.50) TaxID=1284197 RepID=S8AS98_DACHA|nr:hypothetical protein H072_248 [Dactylellina haptotyla CBS 200.50]
MQLPKVGESYSQVLNLTYKSLEDPSMRVTMTDFQAAKAAETDSFTPTWSRGSAGQFEGAVDLNCTLAAEHLAFARILLGLIERF